jgi:anti-sigma regulatory factor (Ser/Thr protein kinase)
MDLAANDRAPRIGRLFVRATLEAWQCRRDEVEDSELLTSEAVTNAVADRDTPTVVLAVRRFADRVRVEISDHDHRLSPPHGTAQLIIGKLAAAWGVETIQDDGSTLWFELPC